MNYNEPGNILQKMVYSELLYDNVYIGKTGHKFVMHL